VEGWAGPDRAVRLARYETVRGFTERLCEPLSTEDYVVQTTESVSPTKWHLAHVSWFFETFLLEPWLDGYEPLDEAYAYLFNSYYVQAGERHCRDRRGWITRPSVEEVYEFRRYVDRHMRRLLDEADREILRDEIVPRLEIGLHHEQQHQELLLTDIKHVFGVNPLRPAYREDAAGAGGEAPPLRWVDFDGGLVAIGHDGDGFCFDNETPRHREYLEPYRLASRLVTCGEFLEFMEDDGYQRPELWLSDGWAAVRENEWTEPFYWERDDGRWRLHTLGGMRDVREDEPVCHVTYFEADAFARWAGARLPTEAEWEAAAQHQPVRGNFVNDDDLHPRPASEDDSGPVLQLYGDVWEWTRSQYSPYPGYEPLPGALGEYNGKFMCGQYVLRGGCCATPQSHIRATYRNFFYPPQRWQFGGVRLARDTGKD
jgi:ergothioneine biosynthesis protein EgtB